MAGDAGNSNESNGKRVVGRPFKKGQSGNPTGRPKGKRTLIKKLTEDGESLIQKLVDAAFRRDEFIRIAHRDQLAAVKLLMEYLWGKPTQPLADSDGGPLPRHETHVSIKNEISADTLAQILGFVKDLGLESDLKQCLAGSNGSHRN